MAETAFAEPTDHKITTDRNTEESSILIEGVVNGKKVRIVDQTRYSQWAKEHPFRVLKAKMVNRISRILSQPNNNRHR